MSPCSPLGVAIPPPEGRSVPLLSLLGRSVSLLSPLQPLGFTIVSPKVARFRHCPSPLPLRSASCSVSPLSPRRPLGSARSRCALFFLHSQHPGYHLCVCTVQEPPRVYSSSLRIWAEPADATQREEGSPPACRQVPLGRAAHFSFCLMHTLNIIGAFLLYSSLVVCAPARCVSGRSPQTQRRESRDTRSDRAASHHLWRCLACPFCVEPPFFMPLVVGLSISAQVRFRCPACAPLPRAASALLFPFAPLPPGGLAPLAAELDVGAGRLVVAAVCCCHFRMRARRRCFCS